MLCSNYKDVVRKMMKDNGYSIRDLSRKTGYPKTTLYSWEKGKVAIPFEKALKVFDALNYEVILLRKDFNKVKTRGKNE